MSIVMVLNIATCLVLSTVIMLNTATSGVLALVTMLNTASFVGFVNSYIVEHCYSCSLSTVSF